MVPYCRPTLHILEREPIAPPDAVAVIIPCFRVRRHIIEVLAGVGLFLHDTERLRDALAAQARAEPHTALTVSAGVAAWRAGRSAEQVLEAADEMLYAAKRAGRDRVAVETAPAEAESGTSSS